VIVVVEVVIVVVKVVVVLVVIVEVVAEVVICQSSHISIFCPCFPSCQSILYDEYHLNY